MTNRSYYPNQVLGRRSKTNSRVQCSHGFLVLRSNKVSQWIFFSETGVKGMLEDSEYDSVDIVSPFTGAIVDEFCGLFETAVATKIFTEYVDVTKRIHEKNFKPRLDKKLANKTRKFAHFIQGTYF